MPHVIGAKGDIVAILWALHDPLVTPVPANRNDKILWVSKVTDQPGSNLQITARRLTSSGASGPAVQRTVIGGPGPSSVEMPTAGCWQFTLRWSGHVDTLDLSYATLAASHYVWPILKATESSCGGWPEATSVKQIWGTYVLSITYRGDMTNLQDDEVDGLSRSVAMLSPGQPVGFKRETVLDVLRQLKAVTAERDALLAERVGRSRHPSEHRDRSSDCGIAVPTAVPLYGSERSKGSDQ
jgi:hypothetical protein